MNSSLGNANIYVNVQFFLCFILNWRAISKYKPLGACIWRGDLTDTREKRSAHACLPCFRREFACASPNQNYTRYQNKLDSGREIQKSKLHTQKISLEFHEHKVY